MTRSTFISETRKFRLGTRIVCSDGEDGSLVSIGFDAAHRQLLAIGIHIGRLFSGTVYLPFARVVDATSNAITLDITGEQLAEAGKAAPTGTWLESRSVVFNADTLDHGTLVLAAVHSDSGELAYIVAHHLRPGRDTLLREDVITKIDPNQFTVSLPEAALQKLPLYRRDEELQAEVEKVLFELTPLHVDFGGIALRVLDGVLYLDGNISSSLRAELVEDQVVSIRGLLEVKNRLVGDDVLASDVALALGRDPRIHDFPIGVYPRLGTVRLSGAVQHEQQKTIAEEIVKSIPGVRGVDNNLVIKPNTGPLSVMAPAAGGEAQDRVPGKYIRHTK